jgi:hypothetical protein
LFHLQEAVIMQNPIHPLFHPRMRSTFMALAMLLALALGSLAGRAQSTQGAILGAVKDANGAFIPGAEVTLTNTDEGVVRTTKSNETGNYQFLNSKAAHYAVTVTAPNFEKWSTTGVELTARQELRLDVTLTLGAVQQEVVVNGDTATAIETESNSISAVYTKDDALNLPLNNRASSNGTSGLTIISTLPGVQTENGQYSLQGGLPFQTEVSVDGITIQNSEGGGPLKDAFPSTEAISEVRTDGVGNNAEFGQPGEVTIVTAGGTNKIHGAAFWYHQNAAFDAIPFGSATKPHKVGNTFGGQVSGPVAIPHLYNGHDRTFFFGDYEGYRFPQTVLDQEVVPTAAMKSGDFTNYFVHDADGKVVPFGSLRNPYTGGTYGTTLPASAISPIATKLLSFFPDPNFGDTNTYTDGQSYNYVTNKDASQHSDQFDVRGDQYLGANQKILLWGRFTWKQFPANTTEPLLVPSAQNTNNNKTLSTNFTWSIRPNLTDEAHFGFTLHSGGKTNSFDGNAYTKGLGLDGLQNLFYNGLPEVDFNNLQGLTADRLSSVDQSKTYIYTDALSWTHHNHTFKFGADIRTIEALTPLGFNGSDNYGTFSFNTSGSTGLFTGVDFGDFLLGIPNQTFYDVVAQDNDGKTVHYHFFAQDQWKATSRLTLTYGLRYELHPGYNDPHGDIGNFDPSVALSGRSIYPDGKSSLLAQDFLASANACDPDGIHNTNDATINGAPCMPVEGNSAAGYPSGLKHYPHLRFMPRFGFAYRPFNNDKTAIRGGFGMYNITLLGSNFYSLTGTLQAATTEYQNSYNPTTHAIGYQWPVIYAGAGNSGGTTNYGNDYFGTANSTDWKDPYTEQWSLSVDHDFGSGYAGRISYIGSETHDLVWAPDENTLPFSSSVSATNQPLSARLFPNWGRINTRATGANESYHSLQLEGKHRFQHGLQFDTSWTWAKALADNQGPGNNGSFAGESGGSRSSSVLDRHADFGNVEGTRRHLWNTTAIYDLPVGRGKMLGTNMPRIVDEAVGGWRLSSIFLWQTGAYLSPYFPSGQGDPSGTGSGLTSTNSGFDGGHRSQNPDRVVGVNYKPVGQSRDNWISAAAYTCPGNPTWEPGTPCTTGSGSGVVPNPIGRFGNAGVGTAEGPSTVNLNAGLSKLFTIREGIHLKAEGTFTDVLNHTILNEPGSLDLSTSSFGKITSGSGRTGQVSMRLEF